jgi:hypothetical protein
MCDFDPGHARVDAPRPSFAAPPPADDIPCAT